MHRSPTQIGGIQDLQEISLARALTRLAWIGRLERRRLLGVCGAEERAIAHTCASVEDAPAISFSVEDRTRKACELLAVGSRYGGGAPL